MEWIIKLGNSRFSIRVVDLNAANVSPHLYLLFYSNSCIHAFMYSIQYMHLHQGKMWRMWLKQRSSTFPFDFTCKINLYRLREPMLNWSMLHTRELDFCNPCGTAEYSTSAFHQAQSRDTCRHTSGATSLFLLTWLDCVQQMFWPVTAGHRTTPNTHTYTHTR